MSTYTQILYQIVFSTKNRENTLCKESRPELFKCIWGLLKNKKCHLYQINGVEDHLHIITSIHPSQALAMLVKDIKLSSTKFIKENKLFPEFNGWQDGYAAFTYSIDSKKNLIKYVKNQESHHQKRSSKAEIIKLLEIHKVEFDVNYFE